MRGRGAATAFAAMLVVAVAAACGERGSSVRRDLTGVELVVSYDPAAGIDQLLVSGFLPGDVDAFEPGRVPEEPRPLTSGSDSLVLLLPDAMGGEMLTLHVDGLVSGSAALAGETAVVLEAERLLYAGVALAAATPTPALPACSNTLDDDGDGQADYPGDEGCASADDTDERGTLVCDDGVDQDGDTLADFPADPGCNNVGDSSELGPPSRECDNGNDDDGDSFVDFPDDPQCAGPEDTSEQ